MLAAVKKNNKKHVTRIHIRHFILFYFFTTDYNNKIEQKNDKNRTLKWNLNNLRNVIDIDI